MNNQHDSPDDCTLVCAPISQLRAAVKDKINEGWEPLGAPFATGAKVIVEGHEVPEMAQAMTKRAHTAQTAVHP